MRPWLWWLMICDQGDEARKAIKTKMLPKPAVWRYSAPFWGAMARLFLHWQN
jgi:hypothetical protein